MILQFNGEFRPQKPKGLLGTGSPGRPGRSHTAPGLCDCTGSVRGELRPETIQTVRDRTVRTFTQLLGNVIVQVQSVVNYVQRPYRLLGTGQLGLSHSSWAM